MILSSLFFTQSNVWVTTLHINRPVLNDGFDFIDTIHHTNTLWKIRCWLLSLRNSFEIECERSDKLKTSDNFDVLSQFFYTDKHWILRREKSCWMYRFRLRWFCVDCIFQVSSGYFVYVVSKSRKHSIELLKWKINETRPKKSMHTYRHTHTHA